MDSIIDRFCLDVAKSGIQHTVEGCKQGDRLSRQICISLVEGGASYQIPADCMVTLFLKKPDGTISYSACTIEKGEIHHTFTTGELSAAGEVFCELRLTDEENGAVQTFTSPQFLLIVDETMQEDNAIESTNEYSALTDALRQVENVQTGLAGKAEKVHTHRPTEVIGLDEMFAAELEAYDTSQEAEKLRTAVNTGFDDTNMSLAFGSNVQEAIAALDQNAMLSFAPSLSMLASDFTLEQNDRFIVYDESDSKTKTINYLNLIRQTGLFPVVPVGSSAFSISLAPHRDYRLLAKGALKSLTFTLPALAFNAHLHCHLSFSSGEVPTSIISSAIRWAGADCEDDAFIPAANTSYEVDILFLGLDPDGEPVCVARVSEI